VVIGALLITAAPWVIAIVVGDIGKLLFPPKPNEFAPLVIGVALTAAGMCTAIACGLLMIGFALYRICRSKFRKRRLINHDALNPGATPRSSGPVAP
jgi:hypothetical protein